MAVGIGQRQFDQPPVLARGRHPEGNAEAPQAARPQLIDQHVAHANEDTVKQAIKDAMKPLLTK
jgi:hypothetical protein